MCINSFHLVQVCDDLLYVLIRLGHSEDRGRTAIHVTWEIEDLPKEKHAQFNALMASLSEFPGFITLSLSPKRTVSVIAAKGNKYTAEEFKTVSTLMPIALLGLIPEENQECWMLHNLYL
jgi:hypothetical protein